MKKQPFEEFSDLAYLYIIAAVIVVVVMTVSVAFMHVVLSCA